VTVFYIFIFFTLSLYFKRRCWWH